MLEHHERPDGRGYPYGLGQDRVPLEAKIIAVADAFEAMTADRSYRDGMPVGEACARLRTGAGTQFDPLVVDAMVRLVERRDLLVSTSLAIAGEAAGGYAETTYGKGGGQWLVEPPSGADTFERRAGSIVVRGRLAGRYVETVWSGGRVSGDPLVVTMVDQLMAAHRLDLSDPFNFLLLMSAAVDQGTIEAEGDLPRAEALA